MKVFLASLIPLHASLLLLLSEVKCRRRIRGDDEYEVSHIRKRAMKFKEFFNENNLQKVCSICEKEFQIDQANCISRKQRAKLKCMIQVKRNRALFESKLTELNSPSSASASVQASASSPVAGKEAPFCGKLELKISHDEKKELLKAHNDERRKEGASDMLKMEWDEEIAIIAQEKANTCGYYRSKDYDCNNVRMGQNLYASYETNGQVNPPVNYTQITSGWANERQYWDFSKTSCAPGKECGHWRIITAAKTWRLGCGFAKCPTMDVNGTVHENAVIVVCNYRPASKLGFAEGKHCFDCYFSTFDLELKGHICEEDLCVPCDLMKDAGCECGRQYECYNGGKWSAETCGCKCPREYYGANCETSCTCADDKGYACYFITLAPHTFCDNDHNQRSCRITCNTCDKFPPPASCNAE